jgi:cytoskeletal protein RodZ
MNHTIKGIIIAAVVTSMLVVGASMVPIMQNASARSTNTNSNTNSADSSSSSTATAENTNNITNSATASNSQEQDSCAVAVTCQEGSTTVTPPATGTLTITKMCSPVDFNSCVGVEFPITVTGNNPVTPSSFSLSHGESQTVTLGPGSFTVHESLPSSQAFFPPGFRGDCMQIDDSPDATGTISAGQSLTCTITNIPAPF